MKYYSKVDLWYNIVILGSIIIVVLSTILSISELTRLELLIVVSIFAVIVAFLLSIRFHTYYEFKDDYLYCRSGIFYERIKYKNIKSIKKSKNLFSSMALSRDRIEIKTSNNPILGTTYISPINQEEFMNILNEKIKK